MFVCSNSSILRQTLPHAHVADFPEQGRGRAFDLISMSSIEGESLLPGIQDHFLGPEDPRLSLQPLQDSAAKALSTPGRINPHVADLGFIPRIQM